MRFSTLHSVEEYLQEIPKFQSSGQSAAKLDLQRFKNFCEAIGNPHKEFPSVHVAGTNGKGSTCNILASIFQQGGYKTALYTSPHILKFNERFRIDGEPISDTMLIQFFNEHIDRIQEYKLSYFEISTAIAFWWFGRSSVDVAVIEVGLGGRLDATNIIDPLISVITSISLDHTDILGDTLSKIAQEKGGIIKEERPVVVGDLAQEARSEITAIAQQKKSVLYTIDDLSPKMIGNGTYQLTDNQHAVIIDTNLISPVQAKNIAIAWRVCSVLEGQLPISKKHFLSGLAHVNMGHGRFEKLIPNQQWYYDGGHNIEAVRSLKQTVNTIGEVKDSILVLSIMRDKITKQLMDEFSEYKNIYYYPLALERAATFADINYWLSQAIPFPDSEEDRKTLFRSDFNSELVIFSGSFYFYETIRDWVSNFVLH